jgi:signal transduction histidine kinase
LDDEKRNFFIERSYFQAVRLSALVSDISLLNKIDEAGILFDCETVFIKDVVEAVFNDISLEIEKKRVKTHVYIDDNTQTKGNRSLLYSIFRNLADNSLAYAGESNFDIILTCYREDNEFYYFSYADTGIGVPEEHLNRLFERFYRIDQGRSRKLGGTGLGLSIVKNAILFHKGRIIAKNRAEGGLEFLFTIRKIL